MNSIQRLEYYNYSSQEDSFQKTKANDIYLFIDEKTKLEQQVRVIENKINYLKKIRNLGVGFKTKSDITKWNKIKHKIIIKINNINQSINYLSRY